MDDPKLATGTARAGLPWAMAACATAACAMVAAAGPGCATQLVCGEGTFEQDGECLAGERPRDPAACGEGTVFNPATQECETPFDPTECDPDTTEPVVGPDGVVVCVGTGEDSCARERPCSAPDADKVAVCGRLVDTETGAPILAGNGSSTAACGEGSFPTDAGPCALGITMFDALQFAGNPQGATPLPVGELEIDECGRFVARNIQRPISGFLGIAIDDDPASGNDDYTLSGVGAVGTTGVAQGGMRAYATLRTTDAAWSASDPLGNGESFAEHGVYLALFFHGAAPVSGVQITVGGQPRPNQSFYFGDANPGTRGEVAIGQTQTGVNGAGLLVDSLALAGHSGAGGEVAGCEWLTVSGRAVPGVVFVQEFPLVTEGGGGLCP